jgi:hypothetical protein
MTKNVNVQSAKASEVSAISSWVIVDENSKFAHEDSIKWIGKGTYIYNNYDKPERAYPSGRVEEVLINLEKLNFKAKLGHNFTIQPMDNFQEQDNDNEQDEFFEQFEILNNFKKDKVEITVNCGCTVQKVYTKFLWDTDADMLIMGDEDAEQGNFISVNFDEILEVVEENEELIKIELEAGDITIMLDSDYSRCNKCHDERPIFYIRAVGETNEEYNIRVCQDCFNKMIDMKV